VSARVSERRHDARGAAAARGLLTATTTGDTPPPHAPPIDFAFQAGATHAIR
jgi:hypothetical protein